MPETVIIYLFFTLSFIPWASPSGLSLKLIHRDSPLSPLYQPNLSDSERLMMNINISKGRASYFQQQSQVKDALAISLPLKLNQPTVFTVEIGLGTPAVKRTLLFDTGSDLTWTNCKPCPKCHKQNDPLFNPQASSSYSLITKTHRLAKSFKCSLFFSGCSYSHKYYGGIAVAGVAATDTLTFLTNRVSVPNFAFGCGKRSTGNLIPQVTGVLGLDGRPLSLAQQLKDVVKGRFSYCLSPLPGNVSYLRFGDAAVIRGGGVQRTPFLRSPIYRVQLNDLSINGKRLGLSPAVFSGGCIIDSGSSVSLLNKRAFAAARTAFDKHFAQFANVKKYVGKDAPKGLPCYTTTGGNLEFPSFKFHFQGAELDVHPYNLRLFVGGMTKFCMPFMESPNITILGAYQQRNVRMVYDLEKMVLSFAPDDCTNDHPSP